MVVKRTARTKSRAARRSDGHDPASHPGPCPEAIAELARLALEATSEAARVAAINALIDRGYGKLKDVTDRDDGAQAITVRFVAPPERP